VPDDQGDLAPSFGEPAAGRRVAQQAAQVGLEVGQPIAERVRRSTSLIS
jgi:hypothetical protein